MSDLRPLLEGLVSHLQAEILRVSPHASLTQPQTVQERLNGQYAHGLLYAADHLSTILAGKIPHVLVAGVEDKPHD